MLETFKVYLDKSNFSKNTIDSYYFAVKQFYQQYNEVNKKNLKEYKIWMIDNYKPKTVNLRLRAINYYLDFIQKGNLKLPFVKIQQKTFLENVISEADYNYLKNCLKKQTEKESLLQLSHQIYTEFSRYSTVLRDMEERLQYSEEA